jgi:branched-chain amino acid transport system permease protein
MAYFIQTLIDALSLGSLYALAALGIGLLFGILRLINFAHGDFMTIGAYSLIVPSTAAVSTVFIGGWHVIPLIMAVCLIVVAAALVSDRLVFRFLRRSHPTTLMVASFALGYLIQNVVLAMYGARPKSIGLWPQLSQFITFGDIRLPILQLVVICSTIILLLALSAFLYRTRYGMQMRAASDDFAMARYLGVRADFVIGLAFAISGLLAAAVSVAQHGAGGCPLCLHRHGHRRDGQPDRRGHRRSGRGCDQLLSAGLSSGRCAAVPRRLPVRIRRAASGRAAKRSDPSQGNRGACLND